MNRVNHGSRGKPRKKINHFSRVSFVRLNTICYITKTVSAPFSFETRRVNILTKKEMDQIIINERGLKRGKEKCMASNQDKRERKNMLFYLHSSQCYIGRIGCLSRCKPHSLFNLQSKILVRDKWTRPNPKLQRIVNLNY